MILEHNKTGQEFTEDSLIEKLSEKFGNKKNEKSFTKNDIVQYSLRGRLPKPYGGNKLTVIEQYGIKLLWVEGKL